MPQVDFTLNDLTNVVRGEMKQAVEESEYRLTKTMKECFDIYDEKLDDLGNRMGRVEGRLEGVEGRLERVEGRLGNVEGRLGKVENRLDTVEEKLTTGISSHKIIHKLVGQHSKEIMELKARTT